jgi:hypothetical protein
VVGQALVRIVLFVEVKDLLGRHLGFRRFGRLIREVVGSKVRWLCNLLSLIATTISALRVR